MNYVEPIRDATTVQDIADYLKRIDEKYYVMYEIGIYSGLRVSDILKLKIRDIRGKESIKIRKRKQGKKSYSLLTGNCGQCWISIVRASLIICMLSLAQGRQTRP